MGKRRCEEHAEIGTTGHDGYISIIVGFLLHHIQDVRLAGLLNEVVGDVQDLGYIRPSSVAQPFFRNRLWGAEAL